MSGRDIILAHVVQFFPASFIKGIILSPVYDLDTFVQI